MQLVMKALCFVFLCTSILFQTNCSLCPNICTCRNFSDNVNLLRVKCGGGLNAMTNAWKNLDFGADSNAIVSLDLSNNGISEIDNQYFGNFTELKRLDLSGNSVQELNKKVFGERLQGLERLRLANNSIMRIYPGTFDSMKKLKYLDISNNPLICDCDLIWLNAWSNHSSVKLQPAPKCESPVDFKGLPVKKLKTGVHLDCSSPAKPSLRITPNENQIIFEGDQLLLKCEANHVKIGTTIQYDDIILRPSWGLYWGWADTIRNENSTEDIVFRDPSKEFIDVFYDEHSSPDSGLLYSFLKIGNVSNHHRGTWDCTLRSEQANFSKSVAIHVISKSTEYCEMKKIITNKGVYYWPQTIRGEVVVQSCIDPYPESLNSKVTYKCNENGAWEALNIDNCGFVDEITRLLEQFAKVNLTNNNPTNILEIARRLHNYTEINALKFRDPIDLEFIARALLKFNKLVTLHTEISLLQISIVSKLLEIASELWIQAQKLHQSCFKLLKTVELAAERAHLDSFSQQNEDSHIAPHLASNNIFIEFLSMQAKSFDGLSCILFRNLPNSFESRRHFDCTTATDSFPIFEKYIDGAVRLPSNLLSALEEDKYKINLMVLAFRNANLLPYLNSSENMNLILSSAVIGIKITTNAYGNKSDYDNEVKEKINIRLRMHPYHKKVSEPIPAWWDPNNNSWNTKVCQKLFLNEHLLIFDCSRIGYYGLLQNSKYLNDFSDENAGAKFRYFSFTIYFGSFILFLTSWVNIVTYSIFYKTIRMGRHQRHTLINTWLALALLCLSFSLGTFQTEHKIICRACGFFVHYLSLCVFLWVCVNLSSIYKLLSKHRIIESEYPKETNSNKKPIMGIYLVGWGISLLICGINSAVNIDGYASYHFCFLHNSSALNAILIPALILILFIGKITLCSFYLLNCDVNTNMNEFNDHRQTFESIDLNLLNAGHHHTDGIKLENTKSSCLEQSSTYSQRLSNSFCDFERSSLANLRAQISFILLYLFCWLSAAMYVTHSVEQNSNYFHYELIFAISSFILALFMICFYTLSRNDVRNSWRRSRRLHIPHNEFIKCYRISSLVDSTVAYNAKSNYESSISASRSNSQCSRHRPKSVQSVRKNAPTYDRSYNKCVHQNHEGTAATTFYSFNNQSLKSSKNFDLLGHNDIPSAEVFYNPNQINVARKFFKKQKRLEKRNNFELQRQTIGNNLIDSDASNKYSKRHNAMTLLAGNSKINNTNIHYRAAQSGHFTNNIANTFLKNKQNNDFQNVKEKMPIAKVVNLYTNIPESIAINREIYKSRSLIKNRRGLLLDPPLKELDELPNKEMSSNEESNDPLYVNAINLDAVSPNKSLELNATTRKELTSNNIANNGKHTSKESLMDMANLQQKSFASPSLQDLSVQDGKRCKRYNGKKGKSFRFKDSMSDPKSSQYTNSFFFEEVKSKSLTNLDEFGVTSKIKNSYTDLIHKSSTKSLIQLNSRILMLKKKTKANIYLEAYEFPNKNNCSKNFMNKTNSNCKNSKISIRSHDLYGPQGENEMSATLADDYPYQSSNISDAENAALGFEDDCSSPDKFNSDFSGPERYGNIKEPSIDELYEAIKSQSPRQKIKCNNLNHLGRAYLMEGDSLNEPSRGSTNLSLSDFACNPQPDLYETIDKTSSQSSIISFIDPKII